MQKEIINKPRINKWIGKMYLGIWIFIIIIFLAISYSIYQYGSYNSQQLLPIVSGVMVFVTAILGITAIGLYTTKYKIKDGVLYSWSPFAVIKIRLKDIKKVEKTRIPFHIRVGATLYSGIFYVPSLGWVKTIMTNLKDGVLITTKGRKYYMITPSRPERFMRMLKK